MTSPESEAKAIMDAVEYPENYCQICHKKFTVCKHIKKHYKQRPYDYKASGKTCFIHGYNYPCPVCEGDSDA